MHFTFKSSEHIDEQKNKIWENVDAVNLKYNTGTNALKIQMYCKCKCTAETNLIKIQLN